MMPAACKLVRTVSFIMVCNETKTGGNEAATRTEREMKVAIGGEQGRVLIEVSMKSVGGLDFRLLLYERRLSI